MTIFDMQLGLLIVEGKNSVNALQFYSLKGGICGS